jgi:hypothetical protein
MCKKNYRGWGRLFLLLSLCSETPTKRQCFFTAICGGISKDCGKSKRCVTGNFCWQTFVGGEWGWRYVGVRPYFLLKTFLVKRQAFYSCLCSTFLEFEPQIYPPASGPTVGLGPGEKNVFGAPIKEGRLKIFTLNRKEWLSAEQWLGLCLKVFICPVDTHWYYRERQKYIQHSRALGPGNFHRPLPPSRRHWLPVYEFDWIDMCTL